MEPIHNRMPVIRPARLDSWLDPAARGGDLSSLPAVPARMRARAVSTYVNRPGNEGPQCIAPA
jgi:putative SOS response-associated peptidase YedK